MLRGILILTAGAAVAVSACARPAASPATAWPEALPSPRSAGDRSLEEVLAARRSMREFDDRAVEVSVVAQLLWAAQGVTDADGRRTAPSAGGLNPLELYVVGANGASRYLPDDHALVEVATGAVHERLAQASGQDAVRTAPLVFVITGVVARTETRYGARAERYVWLEAGHAAQNLLLEATALDLAAVPVGSFDDAPVADALGLPDGEQPIYLIPVGHPVAP
jgi:SagB-type dehydrogenase family enzyme